MSFSQIVGHERQCALLRGALRRGAAPAYLFYGPSGVGKHTVALEFARALLCREGGDDACGRCDSCRQAGLNPHPDLVMVTPEKKVLKIEQVREAQRALSLTPVWGRGKAALFNEADTMNLQSANALLKTLEEPPSGTVIVLVSANAGALPSTVLSRCQKVGFGLLSDGEVARVLEVRGEAVEGIEEAGILAEGRPGEALSLLNDSWKKTRTELEKLLKAVEGRDRGAALAWVERAGSGRGESETLVRLLLGGVRREIRRRLGLDGARENSPWEALREMDSEALEHLAGALNEASRLLAGNVNVKLVMGSLLTDWIGSRETAAFRGR